MKLTTLIVVMVLIVLCGARLQANAQAPKSSCSLEKTAGDWAFQGSGKLGGVDAINVGTYHLNKDGTSSSHLIVNFAGATLVEFDGTGNTTVADNCILTQTWDNGAPLSKCVVLDDSNEIWCVYDQPYFFSVNLKRIHRRD